MADRSRVQDADRVAYVEALAEPGRHQGGVVDVNGRGRVLASNRFAPQDWKGWRIGKHLAIRPPELQLAVGHSLNLEALLVHRAMVTRTQQREIRQRRGAALGPMPDVMPLREAQSAARKAA